MTRQPSALRHETQLCFRLFPFTIASGCLSSVFFWPGPATLFARGGGGNGGGGGPKDRLTTATMSFAAINIAAGVTSVLDEGLGGVIMPAGSALTPAYCSAAFLAYAVEPHSPLPSNLATTGSFPIILRASWCLTTSLLRRCAGTPKFLRLIVRF